MGIGYVTPYCSSGLLMAVKYEPQPLTYKTDGIGIDFTILVNSLFCFTDF